jgi:MFS family permease
MSTVVATSSWRELLSGRNGTRCLALAGGTALHAIDIYMVTTLMPSTVAEIGGMAYYAWNTTLFVIASIMGASAAAPLALRWGGKSAYLMALAVFALGTVICALAGVMPTMLAGRTLQGLGGGVLVSLAYVLIREVFEPGLWPRAMGLVSAMWGIATLSGPALGGVFAQRGHWRDAFWALLPVVLMLAVVVLRWLPSGARSTQAFRLPGARLALLTLSALAISLASLSHSGVWQALGLLAGMALIVPIIWLDRRASLRLLPAQAYRPSRLRAIYLVMAALVIGSNAEIFVPYFLQVIHGHGPLAAGYLTAVMAAGWSFGSTLSAGRSERFAGWAMRSGPWLMALALAALGMMLRQRQGFEAGAGLALLCVAMAGVGLGIGMAWPHLLSALLASVPPQDGALASASISTVQLYAMALGAALAGLIVNAAGLSDPGGIDGACRAVPWLFGGLAMLTLLGLPAARRASQPSR